MINFLTKIFGTDSTETFVSDSDVEQKLTLCELLIDNHRAQEAHKLLAPLLKNALDREDGELLLRVAVCFHRIGRIEEATEIYCAAMLYGSQKIKVQAAIQISILYRRGTERHYAIVFADHAIRYAEKLGKEYRVTAYVARADALINLGFYSEAIEDIERALKLDPDQSYLKDGRAKLLQAING